MVLHTVISFRRPTIIVNVILFPCVTVCLDFIGNLCCRGNLQNDPGNMSEILLAGLKPSHGSSSSPLPFWPHHPPHTHLSTGLFPGHAQPSLRQASVTLLPSIWNLLQSSAWPTPSDTVFRTTPYPSHPVCPISLLSFSSHFIGHLVPSLVSVFAFPH